MDALELRSVRLGRARIGGYLGHFLYGAGEFLRNAAVSRRTWSLLTAVAVTGIVSVAGVKGGLAWHAQSLRAAMASPVEKSQWLVEDVHGAGKYMVVRHGTTHLKLECSGGNVEQKDGEHYLGTSDCYEFPTGETITLEKWDEGEFHTVRWVYKMRDAKGEYDYSQFADPDN